MPKYLCIQRSESGTKQDGDEPSPDKMEMMYKMFNLWKEKFKGNIEDMGGKLADAGKIVTADKVTDGPFAESKEVIGGYMIIEADNMAQAVEIAQESPGTAMPGSSVEVREITTA